MQLLTVSQCLTRFRVWPDKQCSFLIAPNAYTERISQAHSLEPGESGFDKAASGVDNEPVYIGLIQEKKR